MPAYGYPDWQRGATEFSYSLFSDLLHVTTTGKRYGPQYMGNWPYLRIGFNNGDSVAVDKVKVTWTDDAAGSVPSGINEIVFGSGDTGGTTLPVLGPFATIDLNSNVNATLNTRFLVYGTNTPPPALNTNGINYEMVFDSTAYTANQSRGPFGLNFWYTGRAQVMASAFLGGPATILLQYVKADGSLNNFMRFGGQFQAAQTPQIFYMPPYPVFYSVFNGSTAQTIELSISPAPGPS